MWCRVVWGGGGGGGGGGGFGLGWGGQACNITFMYVADL